MYTTKISSNASQQNIPVTTTPEFESGSFIYSQNERGKPIANKNETTHINTKNTIN